MCCSCYMSAALGLPACRCQVHTQLLWRLNWGRPGNAPRRATMSCATACAGLCSPHLKGRPHAAPEQACVEDAALLRPLLRQVVCVCGRARRKRLQLLPFLGPPADSVVLGSPAA